MINFAVIGTNKITNEFLKGAFLLEDFKLQAVYSRTYETAKAFADKYKIEDIFTDLETMAKCDRIDAVYIASPNSFHAQQSILFLNNGKHVLCEKASASNVRELKAMISAAKENNVLLMEAMKTSFLPNFKVVQENLHKLGQIRRFIFSYCQYSSRYDNFKKGIQVNTFDPRFSNGAIMDIGVYCIHPAVRLFGIPRELKSSSIKLSSGVDGQGILNFIYDEMDGTILYSKISDSRIPCEIQGEAATMVIDKINNTEEVKIIYRNGETENLTASQIKENMYYETEEFIGLIKLGKFESDINSYSQSLKVMELIEEARIHTGIIFPADN